MTEPLTKRHFSQIEKDGVVGLAPGQFTLRLTGPGEILDYAGDIVVPGGVVSRSGKIPMFRDHDPTNLIGSIDWRLAGYGDTASILGTGIIPPGLTAIGDETYRLICAGVLTDFSIGFDPIEKERIPTGYRYTKVRLLEGSAVAIGCLPTAIVLNKSMENKMRPKSYEERQAILAGVLADADPRPAPPMTPTQYLNHSGAKTRAAQVAAEHFHASQVLRLQRAANPSAEDRLAQVGWLDAPHRLHGLAGFIEEKESLERATKKATAPESPAWWKGF